MSFARSMFSPSRNAAATMRGRMENRAISLVEPLSDDQIRAVAPSVFAVEAHDSRSARFTPVPTCRVLDGLRNEGFLPFYAGQARTRDASRKEFTKHMLRLRHRSLANAEGQAFEVVLINANDGSAAYHMLPGFIRFACENGLIVGETFEEIKVRHSGGQRAIDEVIEGAFRVIEEAPRLCHEVEEFKGTWMTRDHQRILARAAHAIRFPVEDAEILAANPFALNESAPVKPDDLLRVRRTEDAGADLWSTFNRVQENTVRGGLPGRTVNAEGKVRRATTREVQGIDTNRAVNRALWMVQEEMARLVRGVAA